MNRAMLSRKSVAVAASKAIPAAELTGKGQHMGEFHDCSSVEMETAGSSFGSPLPEDVRTFMEMRFHHSFSSIRIHTGSDAAASARALNADAYTIGNRVVFGAGQYQPNTATGRQLIAHELSHTLQQAGETHNGAASLALGELGESLEQQADRAADAVMAGSRPPALTRSALRIQRQAKEANATTANLVSAKIPINMLSDLYGTPGAFKVASLKKGTLLRVEGPHPQSAGLALWVTVMKNAAEPTDLPRGVVNKAWVEPAKIPVSPFTLMLTITPVPSDKAAESVAEDPDALRLKNIEAQIVDLQKELDDPKPLSPHKVALADQISFLRKDASTLRKKLGLPEKGQEPKPTVLPSAISGGLPLTTEQKIKLQPALAEGFSIVIDGKKFELAPPPKGKLAMDVRNLKRLLVYAKERAQAAYAHQQKMMGERGVAGRASEMWGQALAPDASLLLEVVKFADAGLKALQEGGENSIPSAQDDLKRAEDWLREYAHSWARYLNKVQAGGEKLAEDIKTGAIVIIGIITAPAGGAGAVIAAVATTGIEAADRLAAGGPVKWGELSVDAITELVKNIIISMIFSRLGGKWAQTVVENLLKSGLFTNVAKATVIKFVENEFLQFVNNLIHRSVEAFSKKRDQEFTAKQLGKEIFSNVWKDISDPTAVITNILLTETSFGPGFKDPKWESLKQQARKSLQQKARATVAAVAIGAGPILDPHTAVPQETVQVGSTTGSVSKSGPQVERPPAPEAPPSPGPKISHPKAAGPLAPGSPVNDKPPQLRTPPPSPKEQTERPPKQQEATPEKESEPKAPRPPVELSEAKSASAEEAPVDKPFSGPEEAAKPKVEPRRPGPAVSMMPKVLEPTLTSDKNSVVIALDPNPEILEGARRLKEGGKLKPGTVAIVLHGAEEGGDLLGVVRSKNAKEQFEPALLRAKQLLLDANIKPERVLLVMCGGALGTTPRASAKTKSGVGGFRALTATAAKILSVPATGYFERVNVNEQGVVVDFTTKEPPPDYKAVVDAQKAADEAHAAGRAAEPVPKRGVRTDLPVIKAAPEAAGAGAKIAPRDESAPSPKAPAEAEGSRGTDKPFSAPAEAPKTPGAPEPTVARFGKEVVDELVGFWTEQIKSSNDPKRIKLYQRAIEILQKRGRVQFRRDFNQSEEEITYLYALIGGRGQVGYRHGREEPKVGKAATIPDITAPNVLAEVKNWNVIQIDDPATAEQMLRKMAKQISDRRTHGPADIKAQTIIADIRGQSASDETLRTIGRTFAERSGLPIESIQIVVWEDIPFSGPEEPASKPAPKSGEQAATQAPAKEPTAAPAPSEVPVARNETRETAQALVKQLRAANKEVIVNIGGVGETFEPQDAINLNPNEVAPRKTIPNHVKAGGEEISQFFEPGQVDRVVGHRLSHGLDWDQIAHGSFQVLKPGGKFFLTFRWAHPEGAKKLVNALTKAGFENARSGEAVIAAEKPGAAGGEPAAGKAGPPVSEEPPKSLKPPSAVEHAPETKPTQAQGIKAPEAAESPAAKRATEEPAPKPGSEPAPAKAGGEPAPASAAKASDPLPELATSQTGRKFSDLEMTRTRIEEPEGLDPGQRSKPVDAPNMDAVRASLKQQGVALVREPGLSQRKAASATTMYIRVTGPEGSSFDRAVIRFDPNRGVLQDLKHEMNHVMDYRTGKMPPETITAQDAKQFAELQTKSAQELVATTESMPRSKKSKIENAETLLRGYVAEVRNNLRDVESLPSLKEGYVETSKSLAQQYHAILEQHVKNGFGGQLSETERLQAKEYIRQFINTSFPELREAFATAFPERKDAWKFLE